MEPEDIPEKDNHKIELALNKTTSTISQPSEIEPQRKKKCQFPTAYTILI